MADILADHITKASGVFRFARWTKSNNCEFPVIIARRLVHVIAFSNTWSCSYFSTIANCYYFQGPSKTNHKDQRLNMETLRFVEKVNNYCSYLVILLTSALLKPGSHGR